MKGWLAALILIPITAAAEEPTPSVKRMMVEPVSTFTWGLYRSQEFFDNLAKSQIFYNKNITDKFFVVLHDPISNRINISAQIISSAANDELCIETATLIKKFTIHNERFQKYQTPKTYLSSFFVDSYRPTQMSLEQINQNLIEIERSFWLNVHVGNDYQNLNYNCEGSLVGDEISVIKKLK